MITLLLPLLPEKLREKEAWSSNILHVSVLSPLRVCFAPNTVVTPT